MALDQLLDHLRREADAETAALLDGARDEAARLERACEADCSRLRAERLALEESALRRESVAAIGAARREAALALLETRRQTIARTFEHLRTLLPEASADRRVLQGAAGEFDLAREILGALPAELSASPPVARLLGDRVPPGVTVREQPDLSGFVLRSLGGAVEVDATLGERLRREEVPLAIRLAAALEASP